MHRRTSKSGVRPARRPVSIRARLLLSMLGTLLVLGAASLLELLLWSNRLLVRSANAIIEARADEAVEKIDSFFRPVRIQTLAAEHWALTGLLSARDTAAAAKLLMPLCDGAPQISAAYLCDGTGGISLRREEGGWVSSSVSPDRPGETQHAVWPHPHDAASREWTTAGAQDLSDSGWYEAALTPEPGADAFLGWAESRDAGGAGSAGITMSRRIASPAGSPLVLAYAIRVSDLDKYIDLLRPTPQGYVFISDPEGNPLESMDAAQGPRSLPGGLGGADKDADAVERRPAEVKARLLEAALRAWQGRAAEASQAAADGRVRVPAAWLDGTQRAAALRLQVGDERWWTGVSPLRMDGQVRFHLIVMVPESDLSVEFRNLRLRLLSIGLLSLAAALLLGIRLAASFSRPIVALARESMRIQRLDLTRGAAIEDTHVLEITQLASAHESMRSALDSFSRYLPLELVRELLSRGKAAQLGGELRELTILISDIRGFTSISGTLPADRLVEQLGRYNNILLQVMRDHGATIDKLVGDGIVAFWGAPQADAQQSRRAVAAALEAAARLGEFNAQQRAAGLPEFPTCFGLARGEVVVGNIGADWRLNYTAMGDAVNLASRLQRINRDHGTEILASSAVRAAAADAADWRLAGRVEIRGVAEPVEVYEPVARRI